MPASAFDKAVAFIQFHEGGLSNDPVDRGGRTAYGISSRTFPRDEYPDFWDAPTWPKARELYKEHYWERYNLDQLPLHVAVVALDLFVQHSPRDATKVLQRAAGSLRVDGKFGDLTLARLKRPISIPRILQHRLDLYRKIVDRRPNQSKFFGGWSWRTNALNRYSLGLEAGLAVKPNGALNNVV